MALLDSVNHIVAEDAKKRFQNLRARYTRDKQKVKRTKKSGGGADEVQEAKKETSELYPYLGWLDEHVINRRRSKGSLVAISDSSSLADESDDSGSDAKSDGRSNKEPESKASETSTSEERYSKVTGHKKWEKRDRKSTKFDVDNVEVKMLKCMTECLKKPVEQQKDEDELFGSFVASQLKTMQPQQNALAKFHINQICFQMKMPNMGIANLGYSGSQNTQGFPPSQNLAPIMNPQMPSHSFQQGDYNFIS